MSGEKLFIKTPPEPKELRLNSYTLTKRSRMVWEFLADRDLINISALCTNIGYDRSNFCRLMKEKKTMTQWLLLEVEKELSKYGY